MSYLLTICTQVEFDQLPLKGNTGNKAKVQPGFLVPHGPTQSMIQPLSYVGRSYFGKLDPDPIGRGQCG